MKEEENNMKKILIALCVLLSLVGCAKKEEPRTADKITDKSDNSDKTSSSQNFNKYLKDNYITKVSYFDTYGLLSEGSMYDGILFVGDPTSDYCMEAIKIYYAVAKKNKTNFCYLNTAEAQNDEDFSTYGGFAFLKDENGKALSEVPTIFAIKGGKIISHYTGIAEDYTSTKLEPNSAQYMNLYNIVTEMYQSTLD